MYQLIFYTSVRCTAARPGPKSGSNLHQEGLSTVVELPRVKKKYKGESEHQMAQREAETALSAVRMAHKAAQDSVRFAPNWNHHSAGR